MGSGLPALRERPPGGLRSTIAAYDAIAEVYAERFDAVELASDKARFLKSVATPVVLDAGCGAGRDCRLFAGDGLLPVGVDLSPGMLRAARVRTAAAFVQGDVRRLPFCDGAFGGIWSCAVLLHLDPADCGRALGEFRRTLVTDGALFISVREGVGEEVRHGAPGIARWYRHYQKEEIVHLVHRAGFAVECARVAPGVVAGTWVNLHATRI